MRGCGRSAGDATDAGVLREALAGADAVVVTVGGAKGVPRARTAVTEAVVAVMEEAAVSASGLDWTIVRPSGLSNKPAVGRWQARRTSELGTLGGSIARADLAGYLLEVLGDEGTVGAAIGVGG